MSASRLAIMQQAHSDALEAITEFETSGDYNSIIDAVDYWMNACKLADDIICAGKTKYDSVMDSYRTPFISRLLNHCEDENVVCGVVLALAKELPPWNDRSHVQQTEPYIIVRKLLVKYSKEKAWKIYNISKDEFDACLGPNRTIHELLDNGETV